MKVWIDQTQTSCKTLLHRNNHTYIINFEKGGINKKDSMKAKKIFVQYIG